MSASGVVQTLKALSALPIRSSRLSGPRFRSDRSGRVAPQNLLAEHFDAGSRSRHFIHKPLDSFRQFLISRRRKHQRDISPATVDGAAGRQQHFFAGIRRQVTIALQIAIDGLRALMQVGRSNPTSLSASGRERLSTNSCQRRRGIHRQIAGARGFLLRRT